MLFGLYVKECNWMARQSKRKYHIVREGHLLHVVPEGKEFDAFVEVMKEEGNENYIQLMYATTN